MVLRELALPLTQTHILDIELAHPNIYLIYDLMECMKGLVLWNNSQEDLHDLEKQEDIQE